MKFLKAAWQTIRSNDSASAASALEILLVGVEARVRRS